MKRRAVPLLLGMGILVILAGLTALRIFGRKKMPVGNGPVVNISRRSTESGSDSSLESGSDSPPVFSEGNNVLTSGAANELPEPPHEAFILDISSEPVTESYAPPAGTAPSAETRAPAASKATQSGEIDARSFDGHIRDIIRRIGKSPQAIYRYVTENYMYRELDMSSTRQMAIDMCNRGYGNCLSFASLVHYLCLAAGMRDHIVKGESPSGLHYWNLVEIELGVWRYMDTARDNAVILEETDEGLNDRVRPLGSFYRWDLSQWSSRSPSGLSKDLPSSVLAELIKASSEAEQTAPAAPAPVTKITKPAAPSATAADKETSGAPKPSDSLEASTAAAENTEPSESENPSQGVSETETASYEDSTATQPETQSQTETETEAPQETESTEAASSAAESTDAAVSTSAAETPDTSAATQASSSGEAEQPDDSTGAAP